jgi:hypothetical protein
VTGIAGRIYLERGQPVTVVVQWRTGHQPVLSGLVAWLRPPHRAPRNVLIRRASGVLVVRPLRGLRTQLSPSSPPVPSPASRRVAMETGADMRHKLCALTALLVVITNLRVPVLPVIRRLRGRYRAEFLTLYAAGRAKIGDAG